VTIVVSGLATGINSRGAVIAYGYTLKAGQAPPTTLGELANTSIEQWYAIDYRVKRRRPINKWEWRMLRQFIEVNRRSNRKFLKDTRANQALEHVFAARLGSKEVNHESQDVRFPAYGDASGLRPVIRRDANRTHRARGPRAPLQRGAEVRARH
jgi:hypothetical protein